MPASQTRLHIVSRPATSEPDVLLRNTLASVVHALESLPEWAGVLASSELLERDHPRQPPPLPARLRAQAPRRPPARYHYIRRDGPPSQRPSGFEETSWDHEELCPSTQGDRS
jgi:hypothetical protein